MSPQDRIKELQPLQSVMLSFHSQLIRRGIPADYVPANGMTLLTYFNIGQERNGAVMGSFLVQWDEEAQAWTVHRLSYQRVPGGLRRADPPVETFKTLPDRTWFTGALQAWVEHERQEGIFAPPIPE